MQCIQKARRAAVYIFRCSCTLENLLLISMVQPFCSNRQATFDMDICARPMTKLQRHNGSWALVTLVSTDASGVPQERSVLAEYETTGYDREVNTMSKPLHHVWSNNATGRGEQHI